ncbi:MAG: UvrB/UvrC motif-containing protein [Collinsella sp.]
MAEAAAELDFERAGRVKRRLEVIDGLDDRQQVVLPHERGHRPHRLLSVRRPSPGACVFVGARGARAAHLRVHLGQGPRRR